MKLRHVVPTVRYDDTHVNEDSSNEKAIRFPTRFSTEHWTSRIDAANIQIEWKNLLLCCGTSFRFGQHKALLAFEKWKPKTKMRKTLTTKTHSFQLYRLSRNIQQTTFRIQNSQCFRRKKEATVAYQWRENWTSCLQVEEFACLPIRQSFFLLFFCCSIHTGVYLLLCVWRIYIWLLFDWKNTNCALLTAVPAHLQ